MLPACVCRVGVEGASKQRALQVFVEQPHNDVVEKARASKVYQIAFRGT